MHKITIIPAESKRKLLSQMEPFNFYLVDGTKYQGHINNGDLLYHIGNSFVNITKGQTYDIVRYETFVREANVELIASYLEK